MTQFKLLTNYLASVTKNFSIFHLFPIENLKILEKQNKILFFKYGSERYLIQPIQDNGDYSILTLHKIEYGYIYEDYLTTNPKNVSSKKDMFKICLNHPEIKKNSTIKLEDLLEELNHVIPF